MLLSIFFKDTLRGVYVCVCVFSYPSMVWLVKQYFLKLVISRWPQWPLEQWLVLKDDRRLGRIFGSNVAVVVSKIILWGKRWWMMMQIWVHDMRPGGQYQRNQRNKTKVRNRSEKFENHWCMVQFGRTLCLPKKWLIFPGGWINLNSEKGTVSQNSLKTCGPKTSIQPSTSSDLGQVQNISNNRKS